MRLKKKSGQTLIEITIGMGLALVIVTVLSAATLNGLKNSQFAQNQAQATKLAQEGIEAVRAIKAEDCPVRITGYTDLRWNPSNPSVVWDHNALNTPVTFRYALGASCELTQGTPDAITGTPFLRSIIMRNDGAGVLSITSLVTWEDFTGSHESRIVSTIANY